jgi:hypothetical protein
MIPKQCVFCGGKPLSKEHIWPRWLGPYIIRDQKNHASASTLVHETHTEESRRLWGGDARGRSVRIVCKSCNGGWMSRLQERAKRIVLPLVTGQQIELSTQDQRTLAFWCAMSAMTAEFLNPSRIAISPEDRELLMNDQLLTRTWKIWIGNYRRVDWVGQWVHNMMPIGSDETIKRTAEGLPSANTQTTTLVFGQLYAHIFSCPYSEIVSQVGLGSRADMIFRQIWPITSTAISWPPSETMVDIDADRLAGAICQMLDDIGRSADPVRFAGVPPAPFGSV